MEIARRHDFVFLAGDPLFVGAWYDLAVSAAAIGLLGGFLINQGIVCNPMIGCGPRSWPIR